MKKRNNAIDVRDFGDVPLRTCRKGCAQFAQLFPNSFFWRRKEKVPNPEGQRHQESEFKNGFEELQRTLPTISCSYFMYPSETGRLSPSTKYSFSSSFTGSVQPTPFPSRDVIFP